MIIYKLLAQGSDTFFLSTIYNLFIRKTKKALCTQHDERDSSANMFTQMHKLNL